MAHSGNSAMLLAAALLLAMVSVHTSSAQVVFGRGACPEPGSMVSFNLTQYLGTWYELERLPNWFQRNMACVRAEYKDDDLDGVISVLNAGVRQVRLRRGGRVLASRPANISGSATVPDPAKPAELRVSFPRFDIMGGTEANYNIVDTDYDSYAVVFSCVQRPAATLNVQFAWILTRVRGQAPANLDALKENLRTAGVKTRRLISVDQSACEDEPALS